MEMSAIDTAFTLLMKTTPIDVDWDNKKSPPPIEVEWDCQKCGKPKSGSDKCECPPIKKSERAFNQAWALLKAPYHGTTMEAAKKILQEGGKAIDPGGALMGDPSFYMTPDELMARAYAASRSIEHGSPPALLYIDDDHIESRDDVEDLGWNVLASGEVAPEHISLVDDSEEELAGKDIDVESLKEAGWSIHRNKNQGRANDKRLWEERPAGHVQEWDR